MVFGLTKHRATLANASGSVNRKFLPVSEAGLAADSCVYWAWPGQLGGLGTYFLHDGHSLDRFYHIICDSDVDLLALIGEMNLGDAVLFDVQGANEALMPTIAGELAAALGMIDCSPDRGRGRYADPG